MNLVLVLYLSLLDLIHLILVPCLASLSGLASELSDLDERAHVLVHSFQLTLQFADLPVLLREDSLSLD